MPKSQTITPELLRTLIAYNPETGALTWLARPESMFNGDAAKACALWNARRAGTPAGGVKAHGYVKCKILSTYAYGHRVAWALYYGEWPNGELDHINHNRSDNRISNLRLVTRTENTRNHSRSSRSTSGLTGVSWDKKTSKWRAYVTANGRRETLGYFSCKQEAAAARRKANLRLGFHENHGAADGRTFAEKKNDA